MLNEMSDNETVNPVFLKVTEWTAENNPSSSWGAARLDDDNGISQTDSDIDVLYVIYWDPISDLYARWGMKWFSVITENLMIYLRCLLLACHLMEPF